MKGKSQGINERSRGGVREGKDRGQERKDGKERKRRAKDALGKIPMKGDRSNILRNVWIGGCMDMAIGQVHQRHRE